MNNLIIIGNGFDLAHNLETSYTHFIKHIINEKDKYSDLFTSPFKDYDSLLKTIQKNNSFGNLINFQNHFFKRLLTNLSLKNWCDIEEAYFSELISLDKIPYYQNNPAKLNQYFRTVKDHLSEYLKTQNESQPIQSYQTLFRTIDSSNTLIINFNYTNTLLELYKNDIQRSRIIHLHGELDNPDNPMIFGYAATHEESRKLLDKKENEYLRNIKKHLYKRTSNEKRIADYLDGTEKIDISIFGHSCGLSDNLILKQLFCHNNVQSIRTFYYENVESHFQTQVNVDRIMNDDDKFKKWIDFQTSHRMPQWNDSAEQIENFETYIIDLHKDQDNERPPYLLDNVII